MTRRALSAAPALALAVLLAAGPVRAQASAGAAGPPRAAPAVAAPAASGASAGFRVRYVSADYVYLDGGRADGLAEGDTLAVERDGSLVAAIAVVHAAEHSVSCRVLSASTGVRAGDAARRLRTAAAAGQVLAGGALAGESAVSLAHGSATAPPPAPATPAASLNPRSPGVSWADLSGSLVLQWQRFDDRGGTGLDYDQPTLRVNLQARRLWGRRLTFQLRGRARHDGRSRRYGEAVPASEWSNRVYALSLACDDPGAAVNWQVGRLASNALAATGPVDGALAEVRLSPGVRAGAFAGALPDWDDTAPRSSLRKAGLFVRAERAGGGGRRWSTAAAATAEYHGSTVSRQYLFLQGDWRPDRRWSVFQSWEIDLNSGWRRAASGDALALSSAFLSLGYRPAARASLTLSYDNRRAYRSWDNRALPDSLFDAAMRTGLRVAASAGLGAGWTGFAGAGWRHRQGEASDTWSWNGSLTRRDFLAVGVQLTAQAAGFAGPWASGFSPSVHLRKGFAAGHSLAAAAGSRLYTPDVGGGRRANHWGRLEATRALSARLFLTAQCERDWGDDSEGDRFLLEAGIVF